MCSAHGATADTLNSSANHWCLVKKERALAYRSYDLTKRPHRVLTHTWTPTCLMKLLQRAILVSELGGDVCEVPVLLHPLYAIVLARDGQAVPWYALNQ
jgi:hypothetical protein